MLLQPFYPASLLLNISQVWSILRVRAFYRLKSHFPPVSEGLSINITTDTAVGYLKALEKFGSKPGLERISAILDILGQPQSGYGIAHVAGTNGKGSVCAFVYSILLSSGIKTGLFSKPHLQVYNERIQALGRMISDERLNALVERVKSVSEEIGKNAAIGYPTEFESGVAIAFQFFRESGVDFAVIETGMGGGWDATNVADPAVCAITPIGRDHTDRLGDTLPAIASEKAGIVKPGVPVVIAGQRPEAMQVLMRRADDLRAPVVQMGVDWSWEPSGQTLEGQTFRLRGPGVSFDGLSIRLLGEHQIGNASMAAAIAWELKKQGFPVTEASIRRGLSETRWPGRLELIQNEPAVILDGTTNPQGALALGAALDKLLSLYSKGAKLHLVVGVSIDKDLREMLGPIVGKADSLVAAQASSSRLGAHSADAIAAIAADMNPHMEVHSVTDAREAVNAALSMAGKGDVVCVCGSLYLVGEVRGIWKGASE